MRHSPRHTLRRRLLRRGLADGGLSVRQCAQLLGYAPAHLRAVLAGRCAFPDGLAFRLEAAFGWPFLALEAPPDLPLSASQQARLLADVQAWRQERKFAAVFPGGDRYSPEIPSP